MRSSIDAAGRIVVPKALREALGLSAGVPLELTESEGRLVIQAVPTPIRLVKRGRGLVAVSEKKLPPLTAAAVRSVLESSRR